jgi:hypothetical protein
VLTLLIVSVVLVIIFHFGGRWVRRRCEEIDFGLFGPSDSAPHGSS